MSAPAAPEYLCLTLPPPLQHPLQHPSTSVFSLCFFAYAVSLPEMSPSLLITSTSSLGPCLLVIIHSVVQEAPAPESHFWNFGTLTPSLKFTSNERSLWVKHPVHFVPITWIPSHSNPIKLVISFFKLSKLISFVIFLFILHFVDEQTKA